MSVVTEAYTQGPMGPSGPGAIKVEWDGTAWPARPGAATTLGVPVFWYGGPTEPAGAIDGDVWVSS